MTRQEAEGVKEKEEILSEKIYKLELLENKFKFQLEDFASRFFEKLMPTVPTVAAAAAPEAAPVATPLATPTNNEGIDRLSSFLKSAGLPKEPAAPILPTSQSVSAEVHALIEERPAERRASSVCSDFATAASNMGANLTDSVVQYIKGINLSINSTPIDQVEF